ncbi:septation protein A [Limnobacter parvus]|uniref:Inner membrane-spanning protein YciB n=1 Tax=Limnobacter parvus TaxID=2939690 RepID=A0ABT1XI21_9BURK|nr:septation protein A [Limnobacter parvus]MCR2746925.1 septation protein A [Limnobacter parvus]
MKLLLDFLPIVLFFVSFKWAGSNLEQTQSLLEPLLTSVSSAEIQTAQLPILLATVVAILATVLQIIYQKATGKKVENMQWIGLALIAVFGGATLILQNETFIKWKPTVLYLAMAAGFLIAYAFKRNPIEMMMKGQVDLPAHAWATLLWAWVSFFVVMAVLNIVVAYTFSTEVWVDFKLFGSLGATLVFVVGQGIYMSKHMKESSEAK